MKKPMTAQEAGVRGMAVHAAAKADFAKMKASLKISREQGLKLREERHRRWREGY